MTPHGQRCYGALLQSEHRTLNTAVASAQPLLQASGVEHDKPKVYADRITVLACESTFDIRQCLKDFHTRAYLHRL